MFSLVVQMEVRPDRREEFLAGMAANAEASVRDEPGRTSICTTRLNIAVLSFASLYTRCIHSTGRRQAEVPMSRLSPQILRAFSAEVLTSLGVPDDDAALIADSLVQADLWGHQSHGVLRLPWYAARIRSGAMTARTDSAVLSDTGPLVLLDGRHGIGQVLTERARAIAVERARTHGVGAVGVRNSNHFGTAMYFTRRAAADGCVAILTTNASPAMAPWGGRAKALGTNPWSIAAPGPDGRTVAEQVVVGQVNTPGSLLVTHTAEEFA